ncbi:MAG: TetR/AcrR family transcriptional regulator [Oscillospiraceae bacterium]|nr:TetR/AcrR family transcriptional regulator [Oscillospiraceae bacterium]
MDRRQQKTRRAIFDAFIRLLAKSSYSSITVQKIIDEANIGRSTFYAHFETKDELIKALCTDIFRHVFSDTLTKERTHDFSGGEAGMKERITHILYHLRDNRAYLHGILSCESGEVFMRYFKEYLTDVFDGALACEDCGVPRDYLLHHTVCDFAETVRWWLKDDKYSPEQIGEFFMKTTPFLA